MKILLKINKLGTINPGSVWKIWKFAFSSFVDTCTLLVPYTNLSTRLELWLSKGLCNDQI